MNTTKEARLIMHVLLVTNPDDLENQHWSQLKRLGRLHHGADGYSEPELYLEVPLPRRHTIAEQKKMLPCVGVQVAEGYRPVPAYDVELPSRRLTAIDYTEQYGYPTGDYSVAHHTGLACPWCGRGSLRGIHEIGGTPQTWKTILFCYTCRRLVKVVGRYPREDRPNLARLQRPSGMKRIERKLTPLLDYDWEQHVREDPF
jgi:hypothetical protein